MMQSILDKILKDWVYEIARNHGYNGCPRALASMVYKLFGKITWSAVSVNQQLSEELHKPVITEEKCIWDLKTIFGQ